MKRAILLAGVAVLALAACGKKADTAGGSAASATAPEAARPAATASMPVRKSGLWEQTMSMAQMKQTSRMCLDEASEKKMKLWGEAARKDTDCSEEKITPRLGGGMDFHSVCHMGESGTITADGSATGDFNSHYVVTVNTVTSGSSMAQANGPHKMTMEATWKGPCPAGMKGGDIDLGNGMRFNPADQTAAMGRGPGANMTPADIDKLRAQAREMAKAAKGAQ